MNNLFISIRYSQIFKIFLFIFVFSSCNENSIYSEVSAPKYENGIVELRSSLPERLSQDNSFHQLVKMSTMMMQSVLSPRNRLSTQQNILEVVAIKHELGEPITQEELLSAMNALGFSDEHSFKAFEREYVTASSSLKQTYPELSTMDQDELAHTIEDAITIMVDDDPGLLADLVLDGFDCNLDVPRDRDGNFDCDNPFGCLEEALDDAKIAAADAEFRAISCGLASLSITIALSSVLSGISGGNVVVGISLGLFAGATVFNECTDLVINAFEAR